VTIKLFGEKKLESPMNLKASCKNRPATEFLWSQDFGSDDPSLPSHHTGTDTGPYATPCKRNLGREMSQIPTQGQ